jgi:rRNA maturation protein Rpf1
MGDKVDIKSVKKELLGLVDDAARTGIERMAVKSENRGRPRYKYRFVC